MTGPRSQRIPAICSGAWLTLCAAGWLSATRADDSTNDPPQRELAAALTEYETAAATAASDPAGSARLFESSAQRFESLIAGGARNGWIEYNLGNARFQLGSIGEAILHYRRAERLIPRDPDLRQNLANARRQCLTSIPPSRGSALLRGVCFWHETTSWWERIAAALIANAALWTFVSLYLTRGRRAWLYAACLAAMATLASGGSLAVQSVQEHRRPPGVVVARDVAVFKGPGQGYGRRFEQPLQPGTEFARIQQRGDWWSIELPDGQTGWVPARSSALVAAP